MRSRHHRYHGRGAIQRQLKQPWLGLLLAAVSAPCLAGCGGDSSNVGAASSTGVSVGEKPQVYLVRADGKELRQLTNDGPGHSGLAWSPDGKQIASTSSDTAGGEISVMPLDGTEKRIRIDRDFGFPTSIAWSPNGAMLAFEARRDEKVAIATVKTDGSGLKRIASHEAGRIVPGGPTWSPDGRKLTYARGFKSLREAPPKPKPGGAPLLAPAGGVLKIVIVDRNGGRSHRITRGRSEEWDPRWSPTGKWILFTREGREGRGGLFKVSPSGRRERPVVTELIGPNSAEWSSDGNRVAFSGVAFAGDRRTHIYVAGANGVRRPRMLPREVALVRPSWSPNGTRLTYADSDGVQVIAADNTHHRVLAKLPGAEIKELSWSHDGKWIVFIAQKRPTQD